MAAFLPTSNAIAQGGVASPTPIASLTPAKDEPFNLKMPTVGQVIREIQGHDPVDTGARQAAAMIYLREIIDFKNHTQIGITKEQWRCLQIYNSAHYELNPVLESSRHYTHDEFIEWINAYHIYVNDPAVRDELLRHFFSPAFVADYHKLLVELSRRRARCDFNCGPNKAVEAFFSNVTIDCAELGKERYNLKP